MMRPAKWLGLPFLLTAFLLMALACGPVAQPDQEPLGNVIAAPQQYEGTAGEDDATEEATRTPVPTASPTPEPTETPVPVPTVCIILPPELQGGELQPGEVERDGLQYLCHELQMEAPTPKYANFGSLSDEAQEAEEALAAQRADSSRQVVLEYVGVYAFFDTAENLEAAVAWIEKNGYWTADSGRTLDYNTSELILGGDLPTTVLVPLSQQEGFIRLEEVGPPHSPGG